MPEIIQDFMKKLSKKPEITLNHTKNQKIPSTNNITKLFFGVTFPGKIKRIFRTYKMCSKINTIKQLILDKKKCFGRKMKIHQFLHSLNLC